MNREGRYTDRPWRKSRLAARILIRKAEGRLTERDRFWNIGVLKNRLSSADRRAIGAFTLIELFCALGGHQFHDVESFQFL